jgi:hypothetical protein
MEHARKLSAYMGVQEVFPLYVVISRDLPWVQLQGDPLQLLALIKMAA